MGVPGLARTGLPTGAHPTRVVRLIRDSLRHGRIEQHLLSASPGFDRRAVGRASSGRLRLRDEARPVRIAPYEAARRSLVAPEPRRPRLSSRARARTYARAAPAALAAKRAAARRVPRGRAVHHALGRRVP